MCCDAITRRKILAMVPGVVLSPGMSLAADGPAQADAQAFSRYAGISETSGDPRFDDLMRKMLADVAAHDQVNPSFGFYDDSAAPNAFAVSDNRLPNSNGSVLFGRTLLGRYKTAEDGDLAIIAVCAHEYGHVVQLFSPYYARLVAGEFTSKRLELHADYLSGHYLGVRKLSFGYEEARNLAKAWNALGDTAYTNPGHHGTPEERLDAIQTGYQLAKDKPKLSIRGVCEAGAGYLGA